MNRLRPPHGQAMVEFAVVLPLLLLLLVGIVEFGILASHLLVLRYASYDVARNAAVGQSDDALRSDALLQVSSVVRHAGIYTTATVTDPVSGLPVYVVTFSDDGDAEWVQLRVTPAASQRKPGAPVLVQLVYQYRPFLAGWAVPGGYTWTIGTTARIETPPK